MDLTMASKVDRPLTVEEKEMLAGIELNESILAFHDCVMNGMHPTIKPPPHLVSSIMG
jgi:hypothetical protein